MSTVVAGVTLSKMESISSAASGWLHISVLAYKKLRYETNQPHLRLQLAMKVLKTTAFAA